MAFMKRLALRAALAVSCLLVTLAAVLTVATPASAHAVLISSSPTADTVVPTAPAQIVLTFSETVREVPGRIRVIGPDGKRIDRGRPKFEGSMVTITVDQNVPRGTYLVSYRVISADSHPVGGGFTYSVGERTTPPDEADSGSDVNTVVATAVVTAKFLGYAGLVLLVGPVLVLTLLWPRRLARTVPARLIWTGFGLIIASTLAGLWLQVPYTAGGGLFEVDLDGLIAVLGSQFGAAQLTRIGVLLAAILLIRPIVAGTDGRADRLMLLALAVVGFLTWPLAGHPAASTIPPVSVAVDAVHLVSMAVWLGGLLMLVLFLLRWATTEELGAILPIWSRWATLAVSGLLLAGLVQGLLEIGSLNALLSTTYGRLLLTKVGLVALVLLVAAISRHLVQTGIGAHRPSWLRRAVWVELVITAVVLGVTSTLVHTTPARTAIIEQRMGSFFSTRLTNDLFSLQVELYPARRGNNSLHLYAFTPDSSRPLSVAEWKVTAALPAHEVEPIEVPLLPLTDSHVTGEVSMPTAGDWELRFTLRVSEIDQATVNVTVPIK